MTQTRIRPIIRITLIISGILIVAAGIAALWLSQHYKSVIREQLPQVVARAGKKKYKSSLEDVSINILTRKITLYGFRLWYDSTGGQTRPAMTVALDIPAIHISGINWAALLREQDVDCRLLQLDRPDIKVVQSADTAADSLVQEARDTGSARKFPEAVRFGHIYIAHAKLLYEIRNTVSQMLSVQDADIHAYDWQLDLADQKKDSTRLFYAANLALHCSDIRYGSSKDIYRYSVDTAIMDTRIRGADLYGLKIISPVSQKEFYRIAGHQKDLFHVFFGHVAMSGFDLRNLVYRNSIAADSMLLERGAVDVYFSRLPAPDTRSKLGRFPNQLLLKLPLGINVAHTRVRQGHASYTEVNEDTELPGALKFDGLYGTIRNITNDSAAIRKNNHCVLDLKGTFNGGADVRGAFDFLLSDTSGVFALDGYLKNVQEQQVSAAAKALAKTEVSNIKVQLLDIHVQGDQYQARGKFRFLYTDLALTVQKLDDETGKMKDRPLLSLVANKLLLYSSNPMPGEAERTALTEVQRDPHKSFFNLIWRNIFEGVKTTTLRNTGLAKAISKGRVNRKERQPANNKKQQKGK